MMLCWIGHTGCLCKYRLQRLLSSLDIESLRIVGSLSFIVDCQLYQSTISVIRPLRWPEYVASCCFSRRGQMSYSEESHQTVSVSLAAKCNEHPTSQVLRTKITSSQYFWLKILRIFFSAKNTDQKNIFGQKYRAANIVWPAEKSQLGDQHILRDNFFISNLPENWLQKYDTMSDILQFGSKRPACKHNVLSVGL